MKRKILATLLTLALILTMLPLSASAAEVSVSLSYDSPTVGDELTATVTPTPAGEILYSWNGATPGTSSTYTVQSTDIGGTVSVEISLGGENTEDSILTATASTTGTVAAKTIPQPTISNTSPKIGDTLSVTNAPADGSFSYAWSTSGGGSGTDATYVVQADDYDKTISVKITSISGNYGTNVESTASASTNAVGYKAIPNITIAANPKAGDTLTIDGVPTDATFTYAWSKTGGSGSALTAPIDAATYDVKASDIGNEIKVTISVSGDSIYGTADKDSNTTGAVAAKAIPKPTISDTTPQVNDVLEISNLPVDGNFSYLWSSGDGVLGSTTTGNTYTVHADDIDKAIKVQITSIDGLYGTTVQSAESDATSAVTAASPALTSYTITIPANPKVGDTLTISSEPNGVTFASYSWTDGSGNVLAITENYTVTAADAGKTIKVTTVANGSYDTTPVESNETSTVVYKLTAGGGAVTKGNTLSFTFNTDGVAEGVAINVDGHAIDSTKFTKASGSTIITLKADYLKTLSTGNHTLTGTLDSVAFAPQSFTVNNAPSTPAPTPAPAPGRANPSTGA